MDWYRWELICILIIRDYDIEALYDAMKVSANVDTFGFSEGNCLFKGSWLYKEYDGYIPCGMDINAAAKSLEFNYSDWCLAQVAKMLGKKKTMIITFIGPQGIKSCMTTLQNCYVLNMPMAAGAIHLTLY